jgi:Uncharacterised protein family UPF0102
MAMARRGDGLPKAAPLKSAPRQKREARLDKVVAFQLGISAESRAAALLIAKGFRVLARRWKSPLGEIDIVARRRHLLIFVEVKARANLDEAAESIDARQQRSTISRPLIRSTCRLPELADLNASVSAAWLRARCAATTDSASVVAAMSAKIT